MINLFDHYNQASWDLHYSLLKAGYKHPTIVLQDDGFLPEDVTSPYQFFNGFNKDVGKPLYFNQVPVPEFWEISGNSTNGEIHYYSQKRGHIHYAAPAHQRRVKAVDWFDEFGRKRLTDRYNKVGKRFSQTTFGLDGNALQTSYYDSEGKEYLVENHETGDILLTWKGQTYFFQSMIAWLHFYLKLAEFELDRIFYNTLALPFLTAYYLEGERRDALFWSEPIADSIPGNMKLLLEQTTRETTIFIQDPIAYQRILPLLSEEEKERVAFLGYNFHFKRQSGARKKILVMTNSDQIEQLEELLQVHKDWEFHVGAITKMSSKLMSLGKYKNLTLYPNISSANVNRLNQDCDVYLDINHGNEILNSVRVAFDHHQVILGFTNTLHQSSYVAMEHRFAPEERANLSQLLHELATGEKAFNKALITQEQWAGLTEAPVYRKLIN